MARTIAEIQEEILIEKGNYEELNGLQETLTSTSKAAIWKLWVYIVSAVVWMHEQIVERNALISRPHTLAWYKEQALSFVYGTGLIWKDGQFRFNTDGLSDSEIAKQMVVKHCAVGEVDLTTILNVDQNQVQQSPEEFLSQYYRNQIGVIFMKVAGENSSGDIEKLKSIELSKFKEYMDNIKDAGNQIRIISIDGDQLSLEMDVYVDPLKIYINPDDLKYYANPGTAPADYEFDDQNGVLITSSDRKPVEQAINIYLKNIEFNGGFVRTFLVDAVQKAEGVEIPVLRNIFTGASNQNALNFIPVDVEYFIPRSGYFDVNKLDMKINYIPYTFYKDYIQ